MTPWRDLIARTAVVGAIVSVFVGGAVFVGVKLAVADPGGPTRSELTFAGVLRDVDGGVLSTPMSTSFTFLFRSGARSCRSLTDRVSVPSGGAFSVGVPIDTALCPRGFFDGSDVTYEVFQGDTVDLSARLASDVRVTPVPFARFADQAGVNNDCPMGYDRGILSTDDPGIVCVRNVTLGSRIVRDEVVKVGVGAAAFWVDRYEAAILLRTTGTQLGRANTTGGGSDDIAGAGLPRNGSISPIASPALALSRAELPTVNVTWFQANVACRASGKRLMTQSEWFAAAAGTPDSPSLCNIATGGAQVQSPTGSCWSSSSAAAMVGNIMEWTDEWAVTVRPNGELNQIVRDDAGALSIASATAAPQGTWRSEGGADYGGDGTERVVSSVQTAPGVGYVDNLPAAIHRGGEWSSSTRAGVFAMDVIHAPTYWAPNLGFRCVIAR